MSDRDIEAPILAELDASLDEMLAFLERLVNIDSPSRDKQAVDAAGDEIRKFFAAAEIRTETVANDTFGDVIRAIVPSGTGSNAPPVVLMGHRDTVFPNGEVARRPFRRDDKRAYGPGVGDMKAGLVVNAFLLRAIARHGGAGIPVVGLFTSDEEIGSPGSRPVIEREAAAAHAVFNSEPGRANGNVVTGRKGGVFLRLDVTGRAAHSGAPAGTGASAVHAIARKVTALAALNDPARGISVNVGVLAGGEIINMVAPHAECEFDMRYAAVDDRAPMLAAIEAIAAAEDVPETHATVTIMSEFLPLEQSDASRELFELYAAAARDTGFAVNGEFAGGCANSGFAAAAGAPTLCGTGPIGGGFHTPHEYIEIDSIVPRAKALALAVLRRARD